MRCRERGPVACACGSRPSGATACGTAARRLWAQCRSSLSSPRRSSSGSWPASVIYRNCSERCDPRIAKATPAADRPVGAMSRGFVCPPVALAAQSRRRKQVIFAIERNRRASASVDAPTKCFRARKAVGFASEIRQICSLVAGTDFPYIASLESRPRTVD